MKTLTEAYQVLNETSDQMVVLIDQFKREEARLNKLRDDARVVISLTSELLDVEKIQLAETIISVSKYTGEGEQPSCVSDAIKQFSTGKPITIAYSDLWRTSFSTKNYDRWSSQRVDCEYGCCPRHGWVNFSIGLTRDFRDSKFKYTDLTPEDIESVIYYLTNLKKIQAAKVIQST